MALTKFFNEMTADDGSVRAHYASYAAWLNETPPDRIARRRAEADALFHRYGITFAVYGEESGTERLIPFDIIPRIIPAQEWKGLEAGLRQRSRRSMPSSTTSTTSRRSSRPGGYPPSRFWTTP